MNNIIVYSDNHFAQISLEYLIEKQCAMDRKPNSLSIFCFENESIDSEILRVMLSCDPQRMMVIATPDLIEFLFTHKIAAIAYCCSYESSIELISVALKRFVAQGYPSCEIKRFSNKRFEITPHERTVMNMLVSGASIELISNELGKTTKIISTHKRNFMRKAGVKSNIALINKWEMILRVEDIKRTASAWL